MEDLLLQPAVLDLIEVEATTTSPMEPEFYIFREWYAMAEVERSVALLNQQDLTGDIMYLNTNLDFQAVSIISSPAHRPYWEGWCVSQLGNYLSHGSEVIRFNREDVCGSIVVPIQEPYTKELGLLYASSQIISADNCRLWADFDPEKDFPGGGELRMATLPSAIPFGQGAVVPPSFVKLLNSVESAIAKPTILNGKPAPGLADALRTLKKNELYSFFGKSKKYGDDKNDFYKDFKKLVAKPPFYTNMMVEEMNCTSLSVNGLHHSNLFINKLNQALRYAQLVFPSKYEEAVDKYITPAKTVARKVKFCQEHDNDISIDSDNSTSPRKRCKKEDSNIDYMGRYYKFILGSEVNEKDPGPL